MNQHKHNRMHMRNHLQTRMTGFNSTLHFKAPPLHIKSMKMKHGHFFHFIHSLAGCSELTGVVEIGIGVESILPAWGEL